MNVLSLYYSILCEKVKKLIPIQSAFLKRKVMVYISVIEIFLKSILDRSPQNKNIKHALFTVVVSVNALFVFMGSRFEFGKLRDFRTTLKRFHSRPKFKLFV